MVMYLGKGLIGEKNKNLSPFKSSEDAGVQLLSELASPSSSNLCLFVLYFISVVSNDYFHA